MDMRGNKTKTLGRVRRQRDAAVQGFRFCMAFCCSRALEKESAVKMFLYSVCTLVTLTYAFDILNLYKASLPLPHYQRSC